MPIEPFVAGLATFSELLPGAKVEVTMRFSGRFASGDGSACCQKIHLRITNEELLNLLQTTPELMILGRYPSGSCRDGTATFPQCRIADRSGYDAVASPPDKSEMA
jgi:hypothetical protein